MGGALKSDLYVIKIDHILKVFSKVAPVSNPRRVTSAVAEAPHEVMAWGDMCDLDREDSAALSFLHFARSPPFECKKPAITSWNPLFLLTRIYGPPRRPAV
ncbi:hypothetical protein G5714_003442 [Onychostoma macrolepis]|uniref:Uncharacterized protein n=1 Tax=Onychostoma macrolepis TaxID=369639 RepID=A0A7J6D9I2_9TELE|nr:hypothetical protein G5714_003442 [Onychostoma macrolepis]